MQNLAEAEYTVALFMYMRLQGYPPERIAILTTYNGQKHLIRDVLNKRCANNPVFGLPEKVCVCVCVCFYLCLVKGTIQRAPHKCVISIYFRLNVRKLYHRPIRLLAHMISCIQVESISRGRWMVP